MKSKHLPGHWGGDGRRTLYDEKGAMCAMIFQTDAGDWRWDVVGISGDFADDSSAAKRAARLEARRAGWGV